MATDLEVAAQFLRAGLCPNCGGKVRPTRAHAWRSTLRGVRAEVHAECFAESLCWVLWNDNRLQMNTHEALLSEELNRASDGIYVGPS